VTSVTRRPEAHRPCARQPHPTLPYGVITSSDVIAVGRGEGPLLRRKRSAFGQPGTSFRGRLDAFAEPQRTAGICALRPSIGTNLNGRNGSRPAGLSATEVFEGSNLADLCAMSLEGGNRAYRVAWGRTGIRAIAVIPFGARSALSITL